MELSNAPVDPNNLPALEEVELSPVSPRFAPYRLFSRLMSLLPLVFLLWLLPAIADLPTGVYPLILGVAAILASASIALAWLEARRRTFALREQDLIYHGGLVIQHTTVLPFARIQHVETASNPLERSFNLVRVTCFTAGGAGGDLVIQGLERETAERVREYLLERIRALNVPTLQDGHD